MSSDSPTCIEIRNKIPDDWDALPLDAVTDFQEGPGILAKDFHDIGIPLLRLRNIETPLVQLNGCNFLDPEKVKKKWSHFALKEGDLLISTSASLGRVSVVGEDAVGSIPYTGIIRFRSSSPKLDHKFLRAFLSSAAFIQQAEQMATGSVIKHFGPSHLRQMAIALPSISEQVYIAGMFDALDERIRLLRETNATLEAIAQALFKSWFVDFDPVHAKQQGIAPEGIDEATAALFPDGFEESELGLVPRGWRSATLADLAVYQNGYAFKTTDWKDSGHPVVKIGNVKPGVIDISGSSYVFPEVTKGLERFLLKRGDLLVGMTGYVGETGLVPDIEPSAYMNQRVGRISTSNGIDDLGFVYCLVRNSAYKAHAEAKSHGSAQANVSGSDLMSYPTVVPSSEVLDSFNQIVHRLIDTILSNHAQAQTLATLRDTLLPRLISGQLRLPEAEEILEETMA